MWFIFIAACLFIGGLLIPGSRDPQYGHRDALVNSLIASGGTYTRVAPASLAHTTQAQRRRPRGAPIATATARRRSLQRMVELSRCAAPGCGAFFMRRRG